MFVGDIYRFVEFLRNQGQSRKYAPEEIQDALNRAVLDKYNYEFGRFEQTGRVTDSLQPFKRDSLIATPGAGKFNLPDDYGHYTNIFVVAGDDEYPVEFVVSDDEWGEFKRSDGLLTPTLDYAVANFANGQVRVLPATAAAIRLWYLKLPTDSIIAYNVQNNRPVFTETGSVDPEFPQYDHNALVVQTLKYLGVELRDELLSTFDQFHGLKTE
jgi:hypothetical protein